MFTLEVYLQKFRQSKEQSCHGSTSSSESVEWESANISNGVPAGSQYGQQPDALHVDDFSTTESSHTIQTAAERLVHVAQAAIDFYLQQGASSCCSPVGNNGLYMTEDRLESSASRQDMNDASLNGNGSCNGDGRYSIQRPEDVIAQVKFLLCVVSEHSTYYYALRLARPHTTVQLSISSSDDVRPRHVAARWRCIGKMIVCRLALLIDSSERMSKLCEPVADCDATTAATSKHRWKKRCICLAIRCWALLCGPVRQYHK